MCIFSFSSSSRFQRITRQSYSWKFPKKTTLDGLSWSVWPIRTDVTRSMLLQFVDILSSYCTTFDLVVITLYDVDIAEESKIKHENNDALIETWKYVFIFEEIVHIKHMTRGQKTLEEKKKNSSSTLNGWSATIAKASVPFDIFVQCVRRDARPNLSQSLSEVHSRDRPNVSHR